MSQEGLEDESAAMGDGEAQAGEADANADVRDVTIPTGGGEATAQIEEDIQEYFALRASVKNAMEGISAAKKNCKEIEQRILQFCVSQGVTSLRCSQGCNLRVRKVVRKGPMNKNVVSDILRTVFSEPGQVTNLMDQMDARRETQAKYQLVANESKSSKRN
jgi:hypothetical protein